MKYFIWCFFFLFPTWPSKLYSEAVIKPAVIQNRLYKDTNFDQGIRSFAKQNRIYYQSFWTLTANPGILKSASVRDIAKKYGKTPAQIFFSYLINSAGICPLTGTTNEEHMVRDCLNIIINFCFLPSFFFPFWYDNQT